MWEKELQKVPTGAEGHYNRWKQNRVIVMSSPLDRAGELFFFFFFFLGLVDKRHSLGLRIRTSIPGVG